MSEQFDLLKTLPPIIVKGSPRDKEIEEARKEAEELRKEANENYERNRQKPCRIRVADRCSCRMAASLKGRVFVITHLSPARNRTESGWLAQAIVDPIAGRDDDARLMDDARINSLVKNIDANWFEKLLI